MRPYYERAGVTIWNGEALDVLKGLPADSVGAVITDPPYSSGGQFRSDRAEKDTTAKYVQTGQISKHADFSGDSRDQRGYAYWSALWLSEALRVAKSGAVIVCFTDWRQLPVTTDVLQAGGWVWRGIAPWDKTEAARPMAGRFRSQCEYAVWGSKGPLPDGQGNACLPGFFRVVVRQADKFHIAGKPTELMKQILQIVQPGDTVLDPFMGSATTGVAAKHLSLPFIGIEQDRHWCEVAAKRLAQDVLL